MSEFKWRGVGISKSQISGPILQPRAVQPMPLAGKSMDLEEIAFSLLTGKQKHYCPDWDEMAIDETRPEFESCTCFKKVSP